jgi:hypothetical protein
MDAAWIDDRKADIAQLAAEAMQMLMPFMK